MPISAFSCHSRPRLERALAALLLAASLAACAFAPPAQAPAAAPPSAALAPASADDVLAALRLFLAAGPEERADMLERATIAALLDPTPENRLRLGLIRGWPGHRGYDPAVARDLLQRAVEAPERLTRGAHDLIDVYLHVLGQRERAARELQELRRALSEAQQKIDALTAIERVVQPAVTGEADDNREDEALRPAGR
ncbi:MAG TPA: hypothetical protein VF203_00385 [Burkholderiales bacterium]